MAKQTDKPAHRRGMAENVTYLEDRGMARAPTPLPDEMAGRVDARELRDFLRAFLAIENPGDRRRIIEAVESAAAH